MSEQLNLPFLGKYMRNRYASEGLSQEKNAAVNARLLVAAQDDLAKVAAGPNTQSAGSSTPTSHTQSLPGKLWRGARFVMPGLPRLGTVPRATSLAGGGDEGGVKLPGDWGSAASGASAAAKSMGAKARQLGNKATPIGQAARASTSQLKPKKPKPGS